MNVTLKPILISPYVKAYIDSGENKSLDYMTCNSDVKCSIWSSPSTDNDDLCSLGIKK